LSPRREDSLEEQSGAGFARGRLRSVSSISSPVSSLVLRRGRGRPSMCMMEMIGHKVLDRWVSDQPVVDANEWKAPLADVFDQASDFF
jgi:hypothetical protein